MIVGKAMKLVAEYRFAKLGYGSAGAPPSEALDACAGPLEVERSAFSQGTVTFDYVTGTLPLQFEVSSTNAVIGHVDGIATMEYEDAWHCEVENGKQGLSVKPGTTVTVPTWIVFGDSRTNAEPEFTPEELDTLTLGLAPEIAEAEKETLTGPTVFTCEPNKPTMKPWATTSSENCPRGGGAVSKEGE